MSFEQLPSAREKIPAICRHELGHWLAASYVGFRSHEIKIVITHFGDGHRAEAHISLREGLRSLEEVRAYLRRRIFVLFAGVCSEMLDANGEVDLKKACDDLDNGGAIHDFAKIRELLRMLEGIDYPDDTDDDGHKKQLAKLQDGIWGRVVTFVEEHHDLLSGVAETIASRGTQTDTPFGMDEVELKAIPMITDWLALHQAGAKI